MERAGRRKGGRKGGKREEKRMGGRENEGGRED
jgi:hypothetical protein